MGKKTQRAFIQLTLAALVIVLQVLSIRIRFFYQPLLDTLEFGPESGGLLIAMENLSLLSGIALAWLPDRRPQTQTPPKDSNPGLILLLIFTLLLVVLKVLAMGFGELWAVEITTFLLPTHSVFGEWLYTTPVPALLAGFTLGSLFRR
jgi:isoprenylcysteine carboxyl methyltransferase (ICMT) family protein YpbQ